MSVGVVELFEELLGAYSVGAVQTESKPAKLYGSELALAIQDGPWQDTRLLHGVAGFYSEIYELNLVLSRTQKLGSEPLTVDQADNLMEELGDIAWYLGLIAQAARLPEWYKATLCDDPGVPTVFDIYQEDFVPAFDREFNFTADGAKDLFCLGASMANVIKARVFYRRQLFKLGDSEYQCEFPLMLAMHLIAILTRLTRLSYKVRKDDTVCLYAVSAADWTRIMARNLDKLRRRFPEAFTEEDANNRDLASEREILRFH